MPIPLTVPRLGWTMEEGTFVEWLKSDGDTIKPGDALYALESDKATENIEAMDAGTLQIPADAPKPGDKVKVGQVLAYLTQGEPGASATGVLTAPGANAPRSPVSTPVADAPGSPQKTQGADAPRSPRRAVTPRARRVARELGIDTNALQGSGRGGRLRERDVRTATAPTARLIPHSKTRKIIAERMLAGVTQAAPVTLTTKADAGNLVNLRNQFKAAGAGIPSYTDFLLKLTASALKQHPLLQAQWRDDGLWVPDAVHIAVAVDAEAGLLAPVLRDVDRLSLRQIAALSTDLIARARSGKLTGEELRGATFTVTNLGMFGIDAFTPIIHLPQSAILGVGRIVREAIVKEERIVPGDVVSLSLTFDHRVVDGAPAARFLDTLRRCIEQPAPWLVS